MIGAEISSGKVVSVVLNSGSRNGRHLEMDVILTSLKVKLVCPFDMRPNDIGVYNELRVCIGRTSTLRGYLESGVRHADDVTTIVLCKHRCEMPDTQWRDSTWCLLSELFRYIILRFLFIETHLLEAGVEAGCFWLDSRGYIIVNNTKDTG